MKRIFVLAIVLFLSSCASHSLNYTPPVQKDSPTSQTYEKNFKKVWDQLVEGLARLNFVIDSLSKDSGLIVVTKKLVPPSAFANCGHWEGHFKNLRVDQKFNYEGADSANYVAKYNDVFVNINRTANLTSKSNIYVKKLDSNKTSVSVHSQYTLSFDVISSAYVYPQGQVNGRDKLSMDWATGEKGSFGGNNRTECVSTFILENSILMIPE